MKSFWSRNWSSFSHHIQWREAKRVWPSLRSSYFQKSLFTTQTCRRQNHNTMTMMTNKVTRRVLFLRRALFVGLLIAFSYYSLFHNRQGRMYKRSDVDNEQVVRGTTKQPNASSPSTSTSSTITAVASNDRESSSTSDTTIIITSSLIPSHPSTIIIDTTIQSIYDHVRGLDRTTTPMIIAIDGIRPKERSDENAQRYDEMVQSLQRNYSNATILPHVNSMGLKRTVREALDLVTTTYVYLLQHDLRFYQDINHLAIVKTMGEYPDELDIVRFNLRMNQKAMTDNTTCFGRPSKNLNAVNGINFTKAGSWSDK